MLDIKKSKCYNVIKGRKKFFFVKKTTVDINLIDIASKAWHNIICIKTMVVSRRASALV